jgi:hypothetical protein
VQRFRQPKRKIAILELLAGEEISGPANRLYNYVFRKQFYGVMPQVVAAWCRRKGHQVLYETYFGQERPDRLIPADCDIVFISAFTEASALAYALAKIFKSRGSKTVLGGPHAAAFPEDALRYFDYVVTACNESTISDLVDGHYDARSIVTTDKKKLELPLLAERYRDVVKASFYGERRSPLSIVALLSSTGCPYACDFCVDWNNPYQLRSVGDLVADLEFASRVFPRQMIAFYDPNFGVAFDKTLSAFEGLSTPSRNPYIIESSLSILKPDRLARLRDTNCVYIAPGVESWSDYANKAGVSRSQGREKLEKVSKHFELIGEYIPGIQANFLFGTDADYSDEPVRLTKEFFNRVPHVFPGVSNPIAYGGTPLREQLRANGRLLSLAPIYYSNPVLTAIPKHYDPITYYRYLIELLQSVIDWRLFLRRMTSSLPWPIKVVYWLRTMYLSAYIGDLRQFLSLLQTDRQFLSFHEGSTVAVPDYYSRRLDRRIGKFAEGLSKKDRECFVA